MKSNLDVFRSMGRSLSYGSDCSGLDAPLFALKQIAQECKAWEGLLLVSLEVVEEFDPVR